MHSRAGGGVAISAASAAISTPAISAAAATISTPAISATAAAISTPAISAAAAAISTPAPCPTHRRRADDRRGGGHYSRFWQRYS